MKGKDLENGGPGSGPQPGDGGKGSGKSIEEIRKSKTPDQWREHFEGHRQKYIKEAKAMAKEGDMAGAKAYLAESFDLIDAAEKKALGDEEWFKGDDEKKKKKNNESSVLFECREKQINRGKERYGS